MNIPDNNSILRNNMFRMYTNFRVEVNMQLF